MKNRERKIWINRIWSHHFDAFSNERYVRTDFLTCVIGTFLLLIDREIKEYTPYRTEYGEAIAWGDFYKYGEYGVGNGWSELVVTTDYRYGIFDDGDY